MPLSTINHQHGEDGVARQRRVGAAVQHHGGHDGDLDGDDGDGEDQRAVGLAQILGQHLGVMHDAEGAPDHRREQPGEQRDSEPRVGKSGGPFRADGEEDDGGRRTGDDRRFDADVGQECGEGGRHEWGSLSLKTIRRDGSGTAYRAMRPRRSPMPAISPSYPRTQRPRHRQRRPDVAAPGPATAEAGHRRADRHDIVVPAGAANDGTMRAQAGAA
jgi:hypothetical protein